MSVISERMNKCEQLISEIKQHPMCLWFSNDAHYFTVIYPDGDFPVNGVRCEHRKNGKAQALEQILSKMEKHWMESYP